MTDPRLLWWVDRASGLVALGLLTVVVLLGVLSVGRPPRLAVTRAVAQGVHRELPLVSVLLLVVHIGTAVADSHVALGVRDVFIPFGATWEPLATGLGAVAVDLLLVLVLSSLARRRLPVGLWHAVHVLAYLLWPAAVVHALLIGTDSGQAQLQWLGAGCVVAVGLALARRVSLVVR